MTYTIPYTIKGMSALFTLSHIRSINGGGPFCAVAPIPNATIITTIVF